MSSYCEKESETFEQIQTKINIFRLNDVHKINLSQMTICDQN